MLLHFTDHCLDLGRLLDSSSYNEEHRKSMIRWGEEQREKDPQCGFRTASAGTRWPKQTGQYGWSATPVGRLTWSSSRPASWRVMGDGVRRARGWVWCERVDDAASECALDGYQRQFFLTNEGDGLALGQQLEEIRDAALGKLPPQTSSED